MSNCNNVNFHGVQKIGDSNLLDQLEDNLKSYLDNGFLHIGGWINARRTADAEPYKLTESYINYSHSFNSLYEEKIQIEDLFCISTHTDGPATCYQSNISNPYTGIFSLSSDEFETFELIFDPYGYPEGLSVSISGDLGIQDIIDLPISSLGTTNARDIAKIDGKWTYGPGAYSSVFTKPTGYDTIIYIVSTSPSTCKQTTGFYLSICQVTEEIVKTVDINPDSRTALLINFDPNLGYTDYDRRLKVIASGTHNGSTVNMLDTGFITNKNIFNLIAPTGYDKLLLYIDPNDHLYAPIDIKVSGLDLPTNLYDTVSTPVESKEYTLFFDAYGGGEAVDDAKNLILTANSGNSSVLLIDTGYVSGTTKSSLPCIPTGVSENTESYTFTKPAGYDSITIDYSQHNKYDNSFYYKIEYTDTYTPPASLYGDLPYQLKTTEVNGYKIGQVWQAFKKDWVWETGVEYYPDPKYCDNFSPINISGIYVNNNFLAGPTGVATSGYHINYPLGQIIFDNAIPKTSKVELNYSYRWCQVYKSSSDSSWKELQELTYSPNPSLNQPSAGDYSISANHRVQMPCIIIEPSSRTSSKPYQLGDYSQYQSQDFLLHVFTENSVDKNRICDIIRLQKDQIISLYDINKVVNFGVQPLNYDGSVNPNGLSYAELLSNYCWNKTMFKDFGFIDMESKNKNLYWCIIRLTSETIT